MFLNDIFVAGKGMSIWDKHAHDGKVNNKDTGDIACDSYHKYMDDVKLLKDLGVTDLDHN